MHKNFNTNKDKHNKEKDLKIIFYFISYNKSEFLKVISYYHIIILSILLSYRLHFTIKFRLHFTNKYSATCAQNAQNFGI